MTYLFHIKLRNFPFTQNALSSLKHSILTNLILKDTISSNHQKNYNNNGNNM